MLGSSQAHAIEEGISTYTNPRELEEGRNTGRDDSPQNKPTNDNNSSGKSEQQESLGSTLNERSGSEQSQQSQQQQSHDEKSDDKNDNATKPELPRQNTASTTKRRRKINFGRGRFAKNHPDPDPGGRVRRKRRAQFGLEPNREQKFHSEGNQDLLWSRIRETLQEPFSEFLGIMVFTMIAQGGVAQATLSVGQKTAPGGNGYGSFLTVPFVTGIGVMMGVYVAGDSGSYLNPAITVANCLFRGLPWRSLPALTFAQTFGAFVGTAITFGIYKPAIDMYTGGALLAPPNELSTASIFTSFPQQFETRTSSAFAMVQRNAILQIVISALKDDLNLGQKISPGGGNMFPHNLFFIFFALVAATGWETVGQANPAFDFGSRIMLSCLGYPQQIWTISGGYPWIPIIMPVIGSCLGAWLYDLFVFTGASPVNTPYLGLSKLVKPSFDYGNRRARYRQRLDDRNAMP